MFIERGLARVIKNSRGEKTIEIVLDTNIGSFSASAPSGKSKGKNEVPDYSSRGLVWSVKLANILLGKMRHKNFLTKEFKDLALIEKSIFEFEHSQGKIGGNVSYAIETAFLKAAAKENKKELWKFIADSIGNKKIKMPMPVGNCIGGGLHSRGIKGKKPDFQEFVLIPREEKFSVAVKKNIHAYLYAKKLLAKKEKIFFMEKNDENAWETSLKNQEVLDILSEVAKKYNLRIGIDAASSTFCDSRGYYQYKNKRLIRDRIEQIDYIKILIKKYGLFYVEDPLREEDFSGFGVLMNKIDSEKTMIVGDDLTTTNLHRVERAFKANSINALIIKPNQIGSLIEVKKVVDFCKKNNIKIIFSHRSGETMDTALADYAIGFGADFIKTGIYGKERLIKLRRLMEIEKSLERYKK